MVNIVQIGQKLFPGSIATEIHRVFLRNVVLKILNVFYKFYSLHPVEVHMLESIKRSNITRGERNVTFHYLHVTLEYDKAPSFNSLNLWVM